MCLRGCGLPVRGQASVVAGWRLRRGAGGSWRLRLGGGRRCMEIVARQRHGILPVGELDLEDALAVVAERHLGGHEVVAPHPAEAFVVEVAHLVDVRLEAGAPVAQRLGVVEPPDLDIGGPEVAVLDGGHHFGQGGHIAAGEDVLRDPGAGHAGAARAADGVDQRHAVGGEQRRDLGEVFAVMGHADMFEHADRHDPVERAGDGAIVHQADVDAVGQACVARRAAWRCGAVPRTG